MKIITLSNGKRVANFSSPHPFTFVDGSVLPAVSDEEAIRLSVKFIEIDEGDGDISLEFERTPDLNDEMRYWMKAYLNKEVDIVFCPLPMIAMVREGIYPIKQTPFRAIRMTDRINKLVSIDKQCI